ncbi:HNH endonuclease [Pseudoduganella sp. UC29_106]|uniref:HNH endonuclease n=1 Tax=Pseudoduganella sp. UC29_106 TaxID=3374553 RepID=UPI003756DBA0
MKLTTLKPRLITLGTSRIASIPSTPATPRLRGRAGVERNERWKRDHPLCVICEASGITAVVEEVDHIIPLWKGGADDETNLQSLCKPCHATKTAAEASERAGRDTDPGGVVGNPRSKHLGHRTLPHAQKNLPF